MIGSIPTDLRAIVSEIVETWSSSDVAIAGSGDFAVERILSRVGGPALHSADSVVTSAAVGAVLSGTEHVITVKEDTFGLYDWMADYLTEPIATASTLILSTTPAMGAGQTEHPYWSRMLQGYKDQWPVLHARTSESLTKLETRIADFTWMDPMEWARSVPDDWGLVINLAFPDSEKGKSDRLIGRIFAFDSRTKEKPEEITTYDLLDLVQNRRDWIILSSTDRAGMEKMLVGVVKSTVRGKSLYVYSGTKTLRTVRPHQRVDPCPYLRLTPGMDIGDSMAITRLEESVFNSLRSFHLNIHIPPGGVSFAYGVFVDGYLIGCYAFRAETQGRSFTSLMPGPQMYLISDFPVAPTDYPRLSKLVVASICTHEARVHIQQGMNRRFRSVATTAFSKNPISMKYRGILEQTDRKELEDGDFKYQLQYEGLMGQYSLAEALAEWKEKHGKKATRD